MNANERATEQTGSSITEKNLAKKEIHFFFLQNFHLTHVDFETISTQMMWILRLIFLDCGLVHDIMFTYGTRVWGIGDPCMG